MHQVEVEPILCDTAQGAIDKTTKCLCSAETNIYPVGAHTTAFFIQSA